jgi:hypothetical protein
MTATTADDLHALCNRLGMRNVCIKRAIELKKTDVTVSRYTRFILNLDPNGNGSHWVALVYYKHAWYYFDSFGMPPPLAVIKAVKYPKWNNRQIQSLSDTNCGEFCCVWLQCLLNGQIVDFYNSFTSGVSL